MGDAVPSGSLSNGVVEVGGIAVTLLGPILFSYL
jgi:hypothetical protein